jgi:ketopantoate reductase
MPPGSEKHLPDTPRGRETAPGRRSMPPKNTLSSSTKSIMRGRPTEIDHLNGYLVRRGLELGVDTPLNERIVDLVHALESGVGEPATERLAFLLEAQIPRRL